MRVIVGFESCKVFSTFVYRDKSCGQIPHDRVAEERWVQALQKQKIMKKYITILSILLSSFFNYLFLLFIVANAPRLRGRAGFVRRTNPVTQM